MSPSRPNEHVPAAVGGRCVPWCPACAPVRAATEQAALRSTARVWRLMSGDERAMVQALAACRFPASFSRRFARDLLWQLEHPRSGPCAAFAQTMPNLALITVRQAERLRAEVLKYRRQIQPDVVRLASLPALGALP